MLYSNFNTKIWYTPESERTSLTPTRFLLTQIPYRMYSMIASNLDITEGFEFPYIQHEILNYCIVDYENISEYTQGTPWHTILPLEIQQELSRVILQLFTPNEAFFSKLNLNLDLAINPRFSDETWNCSKCQEKKLDKQRNCPLLDPEEYHEASFSLQVLDEIVNICPMIQKDSKLLQAIFEAKNMSSQNTLPEPGAFGDQPVFFVVASQKVDSVMKYYERKQLEESKRHK